MDRRHSAICFIIAVGTLFRSAGTSFMVNDDVSIGGRTFKYISDGLPNFQLCLGIQSCEPSMTSGRIRDFRPDGKMKCTVCKLPHAPVKRACAFGQIITEHFCSSTCCALIIALAPLRGFFRSTDMC